MCAVEQPIASYYRYQRSDNGKDWIRADCKTCCKLRARSTRYGVTVEEIVQRRADQGGVCAICADELPAEFHVDHDHGSGRVRGLLCGGCNTGLGSFKSRPLALIAAANYLESGGV